MPNPVAVPSLIRCSTRVHPWALAVLLHVNDIGANLKSQIRLTADDCTTVIILIQR